MATIDNNHHPPQAPMDAQLLLVITFNPSLLPAVPTHSILNNSDMDTISLEGYSGLSMSVSQDGQNA
jgi:hypothetical protein